MTSDLLEENAELRKQVAELENELKAEKEYSATLRKEIDEYTNSHTLCAKYKELEKENAELKEAIKHFNPCGEWNDDVHDCEFRHYAMEYGSKLNEAKEIIKTCLGFMQTFGYSPSMDKFVTEAEQLLEEN